MAKPSVPVLPKIEPTKTNRSIIDTPVTISGFIIGMLVVVIMAVRTNLRFIWKIPTVLKVPKTVAITEDKTAKIRVFLRASMVELSFKSSPYHLSEKPPKTDVLLEALKEKTGFDVTVAIRNSEEDKPEETETTAPAAAPSTGRRATTNYKVVSKETEKK